MLDCTLVDDESIHIKYRLMNKLWEVQTAADKFLYMPPAHAVHALVFYITVNYCQWKSQPTSRAPVRETDVACVLSLFNTILLGQQVKVTHFEVLQETTWQLSAASGGIYSQSNYNFFFGNFFPFDLPTHFFWGGGWEPNHLKMAP